MISASNVLDYWHQGPVGCELLCMLCMQWLLVAETRRALESLFVACPWLLSQWLSLGQSVDKCAAGTVHLSTEGLSGEDDHCCPFSGCFPVQVCTQVVQSPQGKPVVENTATIVRLRDDAMKGAECGLSLCEIKGFTYLCGCLDVFQVRQICPYHEVVSFLFVMMVWQVWSRLNEEILNIITVQYRGILCQIDVHYMKSLFWKISNNISSDLLVKYMYMHFSSCVKISRFCLNVQCTIYEFSVYVQ